MTEAGAPERPARRVGIVVESVACLDPEAAREQGIAVVPVPFIIDGRTYHDGVDLSAADFYRALEQSGRAPTTSAPAPAAYLDAFRATGAKEIVCLTVSAAVSTTGERARLAVAQARKELPGLKIEVFDSGAAAMAEGLLALAAARAAREGADLGAVLALLDRLRPRAQLLIVLDTLKYLAQTGRLRGIATMAGGLLSIKPIVHVSNDSFKPVEICRTRQRSLSRLLDRLVADVKEHGAERVVVQHAAAATQAEILRAEAEKRLPGVAFTVAPFSPVMGTYAGPGLLGFAWLRERQ